MFRIALLRTPRLLPKLSRESDLKVIQTRKLFTLDPDAYNQKHAALASIAHFFQNTLPEIGFKSEEEVTVLDIGCGTGQLTNQVILPMFPKVKKIFAVDLLPDMVEYAQKHYSDPKIEYNVADIEDWNSVKAWDGCISKLFAIHCFQWLHKQKQAFQNVHRLLHSGGEGAFVVALQSSFYSVMEKIYNDPKWRRYFDDVGDFIGVAHANGYHTTHYQQMLEELGFTIVHAEEKMRIDSLPNDQTFRNFFASICVLVDHVPKDRTEEFKDDLFLYSIRESGRNSEGMPQHIGNMMELVIRKN